MRFVKIHCGRRQSCWRSLIFSFPLPRPPQRTLNTLPSQMPILREQVSVSNSGLNDMMACQVRKAEKRNPTKPFCPLFKYTEASENCWGEPLRWYGFFASSSTCLLRPCRPRIGCGLSVAISSWAPSRPIHLLELSGLILGAATRESLSYYMWPS